MYCSRCGAYSSAGHACVDVDPSAPAATATATATATVATPPPGWHPDPSDPAMVRYWDGLSWTAHTAPAYQPAPRQPSTPYGQLLGAIPRTLGRGGRFDVLLYRDAVLLAKVPGTDPATVGFAFGAIGYVVADYIGAAGNASRLAELAAASPDEIAGRHKRNRLIRTTEISGGSATTWGSIGRLRLTTYQGDTIKRRWTRPHARGIDAQTLLHQALGERIIVRRGSPVRPYVPLIVLVGLISALVLAGLAVSMSGAARESSARQEVRSVCKAYAGLDQQASAGHPPSRAEVTAVVDSMVDPFSKAAARSPLYVPARDSVVRLDHVLHGTTGLASAGQIRQDALTVGRACTGSF